MMDVEHPEFLNFLNCAQKNNLRYMCIDGYAVNFYGYHRSTEDLDIWFAPTDENKRLFWDTPICMGYTESEFSYIINEDFKIPFHCSLGGKPNVIDILTVIHHTISFDEAEKAMNIHQLENGTAFKFVSYPVLIKSKIISRRPKDLWDISKLDQLNNNT